jgi:hypothetical protein
MKQIGIDPKDNAAIYDPETVAEWQAAVNSAKAGLLITTCIQRGYLNLIQGENDVDTERCLDLLDRGARQGIVPELRGVQAIVRDFIVTTGTAEEHKTLATLLTMLPTVEDSSTTH